MLPPAITHPVHITLLNDHAEIKEKLTQLTPDHPHVPGLKVRMRRIERHLAEWTIRERIHEEHMQRMDERGRDAFWDSVELREASGVDKARNIRRAVGKTAKAGAVGIVKIVWRPVLQVVVAVCKTGMYLEDKRKDLVVWLDAEEDARDYRLVKRTARYGAFNYSQEAMEAYPAYVARA